MQTLKNQVRTGRTGHAYLYCGTRGTGKTSVAKIFARAVNCEHPVDGNPCNRCPSCLGILNGSNMNVQEIDAASNNGVENIRDIREQVEYPPSEGRYRVYIIDEVHMLSIGAFNALLKTLEEPPAYVIFILATTEVHKIPITILSRCQRYDFRRITSEVIAARLREICEAELLPVSDDALHYIARLGDGSMRDAVSLLDQCLAFQLGRELDYESALEILGSVDYAQISSMLGWLRSGELGKVMRLMAELSAQGREFGQFCTDLLWYIRNLLMVKSVEEPSGLLDMSAEQMAQLQRDAADWSVEALLRYIRSLSELSNQLRYAMNKRVMLESCLLRLAYPETETDTEALLARIAKLEQRLAEGVLLSPSQTAQLQQRGAAESVKHAENAADKLSPEAKTRVLPRAQYDDLMLLKKEWHRILAQLEASSRIAFSDAAVVPSQTEGAMNLVFNNKTRYLMASREEVLQQLRAVIESKYQRRLELRTVLSEEAVSDNIQYVTEEDLQKIQMEIETED